MKSKTVSVVILLILGLYFLVAHYAPYPLSHEDFGLTNHDVHRIIGLVLLAVAGYLWWKGRKK